MAGCPSENTIVGFLDGSLPAAGADAVHEHVVECAACRTLLLDLASEHGPQAAASGRAATPATMPGRPLPPEALAILRAMRGTTFEPGAVVGAGYRLGRRLGEGGMGVVWSAVHEGTGKRVALKFIREQRADRPEIRSRLLREARAATAVEHPNVVRVQDVFELDDGAPVLVMDLLEGESLRERLLRVGPLGVRDLSRVMLPAISAIGSAHASGVIHRDLKPDNLFLVPRSDGGCDTFVLDFGLAKLVAADGEAVASAVLTRTGDVLGTPSYMSPEQAFGEQDIDHRTDVFSLGVILYEGLSGSLPFAAANVGQVIERITSGNLRPLADAAPGLPRDVVELVDRMLSRDRAGRPDDLREVITVLQRHAEVDAQSSDAARRESPRSHPARSLLLFSLAALALAFAIIEWLRHHG
jgi:serine/threonine-protein kinase